MLSFITSVREPEQLAQPAYWFVFSGTHLLVIHDEENLKIPRLMNLNSMPFIKAAQLRTMQLGYVESDPPLYCYAVEVPRDTAVLENMEFLNLRQLYRRVTDDELTLAGRALQMIDWDRTHQFCSRCGSATQSKEYEHVKLCPSCGFTMYPRLAPAIIVRVQRETENGREILLARGPNYPPGWYSVLAGFVEPGENLETCVAREIFEEVGIRVKNIRYFGSQPWPFPHSLMLGFTADYESGEFVLQESEIEDAKWFRKENMPRIPPRMSISRHLIDDFLENS
ncbi:MAG: NAD(+) diphosphatase [Chloroflexota bacterium]